MRISGDADRINELRALDVHVDLTEKRFKLYSPKARL